jgi:DNA-binding MarR family transcriptional regulator
VFRLPFRRKPRPPRPDRAARIPVRATDLDAIALYLTDHPDQPSLDIAEGIQRPVTLVTAALDHLEHAGAVTARWTPGPTPRRRLYSVTAQPSAAFLLPAADPVPPREMPLELQLDCVALLLLPRIGRTAEEVADHLGMTVTTALHLLSTLEARGRATARRDGTGRPGYLVWHLVVRAPTVLPDAGHTHKPWPGREDTHGLWTTRTHP